MFFKNYPYFPLYSFADIGLPPSAVWKSWAILRLKAFKIPDPELQLFHSVADVSNLV